MKIRELGQLPINAAHPSGEDAHYEPEFEQLQQEIDKLSIATTTGEGTDWKRVTTLCATILSEKSKDFLVAVYLVTGLTKTHGFEGFIAGTAFLKDLVDNFWDSMFPPLRRMRGRMNAINWWTERMSIFLKSLAEAPPLPQEQMQAAQNNLEALDHVLSEKYEDAPSFRELQTYLRMVPVQEPEPAPEPVPAPEPPQLDKPQPAAPAQQAPAAPAPAPQAPPQQPVQQPAQQPGAAPSQSRKEADTALKNALSQLLGVADFFLANDPANSISYRLRRLAAWLPLGAPPPAADGKTMLPPPEAIVKSSLEQLLQARNFEAAVHAAESRVTEYRFWLDITRLTAMALDGMGGTYQDAYNAVCAETLLMTQRLPGVELLCFADGTPFADPETRTWLKSLSLGSGDAPLTDGGDAGETAVAQAFKEAHAQLKDKKQVAAVELLQQGLVAASSGRERLLWRLALAQLLLLAGKHGFADSIARLVLKDIDDFRLEEWSPPLALRGLSLAYEISQALGTEEDTARAQTLLNRIVLINPAEAIRIYGAK